MKLFLIEIEKLNFNSYEKIEYTIRNVINIIKFQYNADKIPSNIKKNLEDFISNMLSKIKLEGTYGK